MAGRTRKIVDISTGKIGKKEKLNRQIQEEKLKLDRAELESGAPKWLRPAAAEEYNRVVAEAKKINLYDNLDLPILAMYAECYARFIEASEYLQEHGSTIILGDKEAVSPYVTIADKLTTQLLKMSTKLGLAVTDRLKLIVPTKEEKSVNKFLEFIK